MTKAEQKEVAKLRDELRECQGEKASLLEQVDTLREGSQILQGELDWLGENGARVLWRRDHRGQMTVNVRVDDLQVERKDEDPIQGLLLAAQGMRERMARRRINQGV